MGSTQRTPHFRRFKHGPINIGSILQRDEDITMKCDAAFSRRFLNDEDGAALIEYGMLALLIAVLCIVAIKTIGSKVSNGFNAVNSSLP
jgi:Flp pilus assembly pilin Flp